MPLVGYSDIDEVTGRAKTRHRIGSGIAGIAGIAGIE